MHTNAMQSLLSCQLHVYQFTLKVMTSETLHGPYHRHIFLLLTQILSIDYRISFTKVSMFVSSIVNAEFFHL